MSTFRIIQFNNNVKNISANILKGRSTDNPNIIFNLKYDDENIYVHSKFSFSSSSSTNSRFFKHYRNLKMYKFLGTTPENETPRYVVYQAQYDDKQFGDKCIWVRLYSEFFGKVEIESNQRNTNNNNNTIYQSIKKSIVDRFIEVILPLDTSISNK